MDKYKPARENFTQQRKFEMKQGPDIYDGFYAEIYNDLVYDSIKNEYEIGEIINATHPTEQSYILDIGSGTGHHVAALNDKGFPTVGLDLSPDMIGVAKKKYPGLEFKSGSALEFMLYPANTFTHILCLYFTIYYIKDKKQFFQNCFDWLMPGGYLVLHLVNRDKFDPIINSADPLQMVSAQRYAKKRITNSLVKFKDFQYRGDFKMDKANNMATFEEIFKDDKSKHIRQNVHKMYIPTQKHILSIAKEMGFILKGKIDLVPVQYEYQYLYILYKPE
jgi:SAM-dependent methyltransferase